MSDTENAKKLFFEALELMDSTKFQDAEFRLRAALQLSPQNTPILTNLSVVFLQRGKHGEAHEYAEKAISINPHNIEALLVVAQCYTHNESLSEALVAYDRIILLDPKIAQAHNNRGIILEKLARHTDALDSYDRAIALEPEFGDAYVNRGNARRKLKRYDEALADYDRSLALNPNLANAWIGRGNVFHDLACHDEALVRYNKAIALNANLPYAWLGCGNVLCKLRRYDDAFSAYQKALALKPDFAEAWLGRGNLLRDLKRFDEALASYDKALALKPALGEARLGRGNVFHDRKHYDEALAEYDKALALNPTFTSAWFGRAEALRLLRCAEESIEAFRRAEKLGGDVESIKYHLAALGAEPLPAASPERFLVNLFDWYADTFDRDLIENLNYRMPTLLANRTKRYTSSNTLDILDLGCGTGLVGECIRPLGRTLTGVDLCPNMLEKARQRHIYDHLFCCELVQFLQTHDQIFDLVVAADVFIYVGDLSPVFRAVRRALSANGLFSFSVEAANEGDIVLRSTLRYAHSISYLRKLAEQNRFAVETIESQIIRRESGTNINGYLAVMRCS